MCIPYVAIVSLIYWLEDGRPMTEVALTLPDFTKSYNAFDILLAGKRIYLLIFLCIPYVANSHSLFDLLAGRRKWPQSVS